MQLLPTLQLKNVNVTNTSITLVASTSYPWVFNSWRTATGGGGSSISYYMLLLLLMTIAAADHTNYSCLLYYDTYRSTIEIN